MRGVTPALVAKALAFVVVSIVFAVVLATTFRGYAPTGKEVAALFTDSSLLKVDDDVRVAGVTVGKVTSIDVQPDNLVKVGFTVEDGVQIMTNTRATVKYKNLVGDRFLSLSQGIGPGVPLGTGDALPPSQTRGALNLDELYNGFAPLFDGLQPDQVNQLSTSLVMTLQGEGGSIDQLLGQVGTLTSTLADKDQVIGSLIENLNGILGTLDAHRQPLDDLVGQLTSLVRGLSSDRQRIGRSLDGINDLTDSVADLLKDARPEIKGTVKQVDRLAGVINDDRDRLDRLFHRAPAFYPVLGRLGSYSAAFQFYICGLNVAVSDPAHPDAPPVVTPMQPIDISAGAKRCSF
jgi:phospholipid/cholesterol/gamma-HCH transport system substrate-binding protein